MFLSQWKYKLWVIKIVRLTHSKSVLSRDQAFAGRCLSAVKIIRARQSDMDHLLVPVNKRFFNIGPAKQTWQKATTLLCVTH